VKQRIFFKLLLAFAIVIAAATTTLDFTIRAAWEKSLYQQIELSLTQKTKLFADLVQTDRQHTLQQIAAEQARVADARCTIIDKAGHVLADSQADASTMENHLHRPEFIAAMSGKIGSNTRSSHTIGVPFLYVAAPIPDGAVRMAYPLSAIQQAKHQIRSNLIEASALAFGIALLIAGFWARSISRRLRNIVLPSVSHPAISPPALPRLPPTKLRRSPPHSIGPRATWNRASLRSRPVAANWKPCLTACRKR
jgi:two-component system phosphate regulon sensor histidine kinase PhoR